MVTKVRAAVVATKARFMGDSFRSEGVIPAKAIPGVLAHRVSHRSGG
jgi:hypothetical protein